MKQFSKWIITGLAVLASMTAYCNNSPGKGEVRKEIKREIKYPEFAKKHEMNGLVLVKFQVNEEGYVDVLEMNASHKNLGEYVKSRLEKMRFDPRESSGTHFAKFNFRYEYR